MADKANADCIKRLAKYLDSTQQLSKEGLEVIRNHKYKSGVYTPLDLFFYRVWWTPVSNILPAWLAPNMITFIGFLIAMSNILLMFYFSPTLEDRLPSWVFAYGGITVFIYLTMDAIDGMQARKTKSSSPLGQLFDHGCDCQITTVFALMIIHALEVGPGLHAIILLACVQVAFFLSQWEESYTGTCRTSLGGLVGVTESQMVIMGQMLVAWCYPGLAQLVVFQTYTVGYIGWALYIAFLVSVGGSCIVGMLVNYPTSIKDLVSVVGLNILVVLWVKGGYVTPVEFGVASLCLAFCNNFSTVRVILASIAHTRPPLVHRFTVPLICIVLTSLFWGKGETSSQVATNGCSTSRLLVLLLLYVGGLVYHILRSLTQVVNEISSYLGIYVFNIVDKRTE